VGVVADDLRGPDARDDAPAAFVRRLKQMAKGYGYVIPRDEKMQMATDVLAELERLRARVAELEAGTEVRVQYGYRRSDGALALAAPHETRRHVLDMAELSGETAVQWEVHTRTGPVTVVSS
jgi:cold shock CspA family protein